MNSDIKTLLKKFKKMLKEYPDNADSSYYFVNFLRLFLRMRPSLFILPTFEVMTIIKHEKPTIYYKLRTQGENDFTLEFLTALTMDYEIAKKNIEELLSRDC